MKQLLIILSLMLSPLVFVKAGQVTSTRVINKDGVIAVIKTVFIAQFDGSLQCQSYGLTLDQMAEEQLSGIHIFFIITKATQWFCECGGMWSKYGNDECLRNIRFG